jgi:hypothetical protein
MRHSLSLILLLYLVSHCTTPERCGDIYDKVSRDGRYFFILDAKYSLDVSTDNDIASFLPDNRLSGEVTKSVYDAFSIGEEYCQ